MYTHTILFSYVCGANYMTDRRIDLHSLRACSLLTDSSSSSTPDICDIFPCPDSFYLHQLQIFTHSQPLQYLPNPATVLCTVDQKLLLSLPALSLLLYWMALQFRARQFSAGHSFLHGPCWVTLYYWSKSAEKLGSSALVYRFPLTNPLSYTPSRRRWAFATRRLTDCTLRRSHFPRMDQPSLSASSRTRLQLPEHETLIAKPWKVDTHQKFKPESTLVTKLHDKNIVHRA